MIGYVHNFVYYRGGFEDDDVVNLWQICTQLWRMSIVAMNYLQNFLQDVKVFTDSGGPRSIGHVVNTSQSCTDTALTRYVWIMNVV